MMEETNSGQVGRQQRLSQILDEESTQIAFDEAAREDHLHPTLQSEVVKNA